VIVLDAAALAVALARTLVDAGDTALEVTPRTPAARLAASPGHAVKRGLA
jgi:2-keto-3-deoxy-6-phosphogluconate aldolase